MPQQVEIPESLQHLAVAIDTLRPYARNPRNGDSDAIMTSLRRNGQYRPVVVNKRTGEILAGNHTYAAAVELGWTELAATFVDVDEAHAKRIVLADNRTADLGGYDTGLLAGLLSELDDLDGTGYTVADLNAMLDAQDVPDALTDPDDAPGRPDTPATALGDVWLLGPHRILCGDATSVTDLERLLTGDTVDALITDPPYRRRLRGQDISQADDEERYRRRARVGRAARRCPRQRVHRATPRWCLLRVLPLGHPGDGVPSGVGACRPAPAAAAGVGQGPVRPGSAGLPRQARDDPVRPRTRSRPPPPRCRLPSTTSPTTPCSTGGRAALVTPGKADASRTVCGIAPALPVPPSTPP